MGWMRFTKDLHDGRTEQICIVSDIERVKSEAEEVSAAESKDTLSTNTNKYRFDEQSWDSVKSSPF
ncbi:hypothetical protein PInf_027795 [Phytophthora infestans]|nr:hypothetical protein PInf_027795 [Phytophthora infestans]